MTTSLSAGSPSKTSTHPKGFLPYGEGGVAPPTSTQTIATAWPLTQLYWEQAPPTNTPTVVAPGPLSHLCQGQSLPTNMPVVVAASHCWEPGWRTALLTSQLAAVASQPKQDRFHSPHRRYPWRTGFWAPGGIVLLGTTGYVLHEVITFNISSN